MWRKRACVKRWHKGLEMFVYYPNTWIIEISILTRPTSGEGKSTFQRTVKKIHQTALVA